MYVQGGLRTTKKIQKEDYRKKLQKEKLSGSRLKVSSLHPEELKGHPALCHSFSYSSDSRRRTCHLLAFGSPLQAPPCLQQILPLAPFFAWPGVAANLLSASFQWKPPSRVASPPSSAGLSHPLPHAGGRPLILPALCLSQIRPEGFIVLSNGG